MGTIDSVSMAGSIVRRIREDAGMTRSALSEATGVSPRTLYALEAGESENFGLGNFLKVLSALGLSMEIERDGGDTPAPRAKVDSSIVPWDDLGDAWKLE